MKKTVNLQDLVGRGPEEIQPVLAALLLCFGRCEEQRSDKLVASRWYQSCCGLQRGW